MRLDLTKKRYDILKGAREWAKDIELVDYICADINCRLKAKLVSGEDIYFNNQNDLESKIGL